MTNNLDITKESMIYEIDYLSVVLNDNKLVLSDDFINQLSDYMSKFATIEEIPIKGLLDAINTYSFRPLFNKSEIHDVIIDEKFVEDFLLNYKSNIFYGPKKRIIESIYFARSIAKGNK